MVLEEMIQFLVVAIISLLIWVFSVGKNKSANRSEIPGSVIKWESEVRTVAQNVGVPFPVAMAVLWVESVGDEYARGSNQEYGLYQLKKIAVLDLAQNGFGDWSGFKDNAGENIEAGIRFLKLQYNRTGSWEKAVKAYNQGQLGATQFPGRAQEYYNKVNERIKFF